MKIKKILFMALATIFAACNTNNPEKRQLVGTWTEVLPSKDMIKSITFYNDGTLEYIDKPTTEITWPGISAKLHYNLAGDGELCFWGECISLNEKSSKTDTIPFIFLSDYSIKSGSLTIDSFAYDGGIKTFFIKPLILLKQ